MIDVGLVSVDPGGWWPGGRYYLHHLVRAVALSTRRDHIGFREVWWGREPCAETFLQVRDFLKSVEVIRMPASMIGRVRRKLRRFLSQTPGAADLFHAKGVDVLFPIAPCENVGIPYVFWLTDFQYLHLPELHGLSEVRRWEEYNARNVEEASAVVVSSLDAERDFNRVFPTFSRKVTVANFVSMPDDEWWQDDPAGVVAKCGLPQKFFVVCNQFSHHKNHEVLFEAVRILVSRGTNISIACTGSTRSHLGPAHFERLMEFRSKHDLQGNIHVLGLLPRTEQMAVVRSSIAILQPSRFEGWSTIVEDGKTLGKPMLMSDIAIHREQAPLLTHQYIPVGDPSAWANAMEAWWEQLGAGPNEEQEAAGLISVPGRAEKMSTAFEKAVRQAVGS